MTVSEQYKKQIEAFADAHMEELTKDLMELMKINSVRTEAKPGKPFGEGPFKALEAASALAAKKGLAVKDYDGYVRTADLNPQGEAAFDMLGHVDVVPAGDGWTVTGPFEPKLIGDVLYGRGCADDKGGVVAGIYAMQAVKELCLPVTKRCRMIIGSGEETGMEDVHYYYSKEEEAPMTATPDAEYPVTCGEKGRVAPVFTAVFKVSESAKKLISLDGGIAVNQVPASAEAVLAGVSIAEAENAAGEVSERTGVKFTFTADNGLLKVRAEGKSAHGSMPELGINSLQGLVELILALDLDACEGLDILAAYAKLYPFGEYDGTSTGMAAKDEVSGATSVAPDIIHMTETSFRGEVDYRTAVCADAMDPVAILTEKAKEAGLTVSFDEVIKSHYVPGDSDFVKTLLSCYESVSGKKGAALCMGGNSYVHDTRGGVCFGYVTDDAEACIHGPNEHIPLKDLRDTVVIYALAIAGLCR